LISSISLPEELQKRLDEGTGMNMLGDLNKYQQMKGADAMSQAAQNQGMGGGIEGMMGMAMMQQMMNQQQMMNGGMQKQSFPPPPPVVNYYVSLNGQQAGPFDLNHLQQMVAGQQLTKQTFVWKQGMASWQAAGEVPELTPLFGSVPPPPPPPMH